MHHPTADRPIEHPSGRFQTTCAFLTRLRAAQNAHTAPLHRFMYEHRPAKPRMQLPVPRSCGCYVVELYNEVRTHVSLGKDTPCTRPIERFEGIVAYPILGGLHHRYARI
jgi:hypothetical protein